MPFKDLKGCVWSIHCEVCDEQFEKKPGLMNHMLLVHLIASPVNLAVKS